MKVDYNQFTKAELASFLNKHGDDFKYIIKPYQIILEEKQEKIFNEIDKISNENGLLIEKLGKGTIQQKISVSKGLDKNHRKWQSLNKELDKINDLLYRGE